MQNNINKHEQDAFSEKIRQKLENHRVPVDATLWVDIQARLESRKRKVIPFWFWLSGGAAVAALALLFLLQSPAVQKDSIAKSTSIKIQQAEGNKPMANLKPKSIQSIESIIKPIPFKTLASNQVKSATPLDYPPAQVIIQDTTESKKTDENIPVRKKKEENAVAQNTTEHKDTVSGKTRYIPNSLVEEPAERPIAKTKNKNGWLLAASVGSNGSVPTGNGNYVSSIGDKNLVSAGTSYTQLMTPNDFSNISYIPPISFGLAVRKDLNKTWGLESGLVYTYLLTTFETNGTQRNDAKLHLHYIGVPLNLVARVWNNAKWEVYVSGGGMIEKGIRSVYVQNVYSGNQTFTTTVSTGIDGIQWSVNGAVGTTYKLQRNLGIFFEPTISYYFDNKQPLSARTEYPTVFGLTAGVRFRFK